MGENLNFRAIFLDEKAKFFSKNKTFILAEEISFDTEFIGDTSIDFFASSIASSTIFAISKGLKEKEIKFDDLEISLRFELENSLAFLGVKGYNEKPKISKIKVKIYIYTELENKKLLEICYEILENSFILNTIKDILEIKISQIS